MANDASLIMKRGAFPNHVMAREIEEPSIMLPKKGLVVKDFPEHANISSDIVHRSRAQNIVSKRMEQLSADGIIPLKAKRNNPVEVSQIHKNQMFAVPAPETRRRTLSMDIIQAKPTEPAAAESQPQQATETVSPKVVLISEIVQPVFKPEPKPKPLKQVHIPISRSIVHQVIAAWQLSTPSEKPVEMTSITPLPADSDLEVVEDFGIIHNLFRNKSKMQLSLISAAAFVLAFGIYVSFQTIQTNRSVTAQISKIANQPSANNVAATTGVATASTVPSTVKPTAAAVASYAVAPNLAKYLKIPSIGVDARVGQVGILSNGALGTPPNVFDTAWYTGSAEPGQPGATLIDGHVSSWTSKGVFYSIHALQAGDTIQIVKGDNSVVNYVVVKTQTYSASGVDMQAAVTPIDPTVSGLNLITCTGQVIKGTSLFNERVIVFAKEVN